MIKAIFYIISFVTLANTLKAQKMAVVDDQMKEFVLTGNYLEIFEDTEKKFSIKEVSDSAFQKNFTLNQSSYPYNENIKSAYWIKFKIKNIAQSGKSFLLESYAPHTNNWQVYMPSKNGFILKQSGLDLYFYDREYVNKNLILDLPIDTGKVHTFYARVESSNHSSFDFRIKPTRYFFFYSVNEYYFLGLFYGILMIMAIYNLLLFLSLREKVYFYYVLYVCAGILTTLADDGLGYQFVWIHFPEINGIIGPHIAPALLLLTFTLYAREFLRLNKRFPKYDKIIGGLVALYFIYYFLKITFLPVQFHSHLFYLFPFIAIYLVSIQSLLKGDKAAKFFVVGYSFVLLSIFILKLRANGTIEGNLFTVYSLNYGLVIEVLVLSFALSERFRYAKMSREKALRERNEAQFRSIKHLKINQTLKDLVTKQLENKVAERTHELHSKNKELEETNLKLKEMTDKANQMSLKLDVDNWTLQKKVLESIRARMAGQEVSDDDFNKIFPDDTACYRYLYELKWEKMFVCRRCGHQDSDNDIKLFTKKCTKCAYIESVTAHTLFHGLKFPINKAFHIAYLAIHSNRKITLDELSTMLDLRRNTCWSFKQKVADSMELYQKTYKTQAIKSWENIIFITEAPKKNTRKHS